MNHFCFGGNGAGLTGGRGMENWSLLVSALDGAGFGLFIAIVWRGEDMVLKEYILKEY